jgi:hypothetical protein
LVQTTDGGYALAGYAEPYAGAATDDFWLIKTDSVGNALWNKTYGGTDWDEAYALVQTSDDGYAIAGYTYSFNPGGGADFWLVKTDSVGNALWNTTYGETGSESARALVQTVDGGYVLAGYRYSSDSSYDMWLVKTDSHGNQEWNKTYGGTDWDGAYALVQTSDGGYALGGWTIGYGGAFSRCVWLVKTDGSGNAQWNKTYGETGSDLASALVQTSDGGYALAGHTLSGSVEDFWLVKTDDSGNMQWNKTYGGTGSDFAYALVQTLDGGYAMAGYTDSSGSGNSDFWLVKTDADGNAQWNKTYDGTGGESAWALVQTVDGGYVLAGAMYAYGGAGDCWLVKVAPESHDVAVKSVSPSAAEAYTGQMVNITVVTKNEGACSEVFDVSTYCDSTLIGTQTVVDLPPKEEETLVFSWNTTDIAGGYYIISANASTVPGETDVADNTFIGGVVKITSPLSISGVVPCNKTGGPKDTFELGALAFFKVTINSTATEARDILTTINLFDNLSIAIGVASFQGQVIPGISTIIFGLPVPATATTGSATVYACAYTDWPGQGGFPHCPEMPATLEITGP